MDWKAISGELAKPLNPQHVKKGGGNFGPKGDYIEGWHAINEANAIFGFNGWSYQIKGLTQDRLHEGTDSKGNIQWQAAYTCLLHLSVGEVVREDVGFGSGFGKNVGDAIEGATKEAVTDALKRALRTFGNRFGLALYDKSRTNVGVAFDAEAMEARLTAALNKAGDLAALERIWNHPATNDTLSKLDDLARARLVRLHTERQGFLYQAPEHVPGAFDG